MENTKKMDYTEFKEVLKKLVQEKSGTDMKVEIVQIMKNNQTRSENLTYIDPNYNLFPSIQLKELYQEYQVYGMDWCVEEAVSVLGNMKKIHEDQLIGSWESAKERIIVELVKESWNQKLLEEIPYKPFLDLAVIYRIKMWECKSGDAVHTVTKEACDAYIRFMPTSLKKNSIILFVASVINPWFHHFFPISHANSTCFTSSSGCIP